MELGGKTPVMVFDDYDIDRAVNYAAFGAFIGAGQTCICASRHLVQASIYDEFVAKLKAKTETIRIGDPSDPATQLGPVISARQRDRVLSYCKFGHEDGAQLVAGGVAPKIAGFENGYFVEPTVFADVKSDMRIFQEEVFGPFTSVTPFKDEADALRLANDLPFGLAAAIRTRDVARAHRVASRVKCGIVWINDHHRLDPASPWGGVGDSGVGRECGTESFDDHFNVKSVMVATNDAPFDWYRDTAGQRRLELNTTSSAGCEGRRSDTNDIKGGTSMATAVNAGARLDRLPISSFHYRIFWLVGAGMFFDGYDLYVAGGVLASAIKSGFSTVTQNSQFLSLTFVGMTAGALITGFVGDKYGRRFTYQINLLIFGFASLAAAFAQDMNQLIACRFVQGLGLGAEIVVGYSTMTEFVPPKTRGRWLSMMAFIVVAGFPATSLLGYLIIPNFGWRPMFVIAGIGSLIVWYLRKNLPESPRWLESEGRTEEAEALMKAIEQEASGGKPLPPVVMPAPTVPVAASDMMKPPLLAAHGRRLLGADLDQHADLRLRDLPAAILPASGTDDHQLARLYAGAVGGVAGRLRARRLFVRRDRAASEHHRRVDRHHHQRLRLCPLQRGVRSGDRARNRLRPGGRDLRADRDPLRRLYDGTVPDRDQAPRQRHLQLLRTWRHRDLAVHRRRADDVLPVARRGLADDRTRRGPDYRGVGLGRRAAQPRSGRGGESAGVS